MSTRTLFVAVVATVLMSGCYTYAQTTVDATPVGSETRALLSTEGQMTLLDQIGMDMRSIRGKLQSKDGDLLAFTVPAAYSLQEIGSETYYQHFELPRKDILRIEVRRFDGVKTGGLIGGLAGLVAFTVLVVSGNAEGGSQSGPLPPEPVR